MSVPTGDLRHFLSQVPDPRGLQGRRHCCTAMLTAVVLATFCNTNGYKPVAQWLHNQSVDFWHFLGFTRCPPKYGALRLLLMMIQVEEFEAALNAWLASITGVSLSTESQRAIAVDGKALRGTDRVCERAQMLIAAYDHESGGVLKQQVVPPDSNEITAVRDLLKKLVLTNCIITADAAHCQQETCQQIVDSGGDYVITAKDNQPTLVNAIASEFAAHDAVFSPLCTARAASGSKESVAGGQGSRTH